MGAFKQRMFHPKFNSRSRFCFPRLWNQKLCRNYPCATRHEASPLRFFSHSHQFSPSTPVLSFALGTIDLGRRPVAGACGSPFPSSMAAKGGCSPPPFSSRGKRLGFNVSSARGGYMPRQGRPWLPSCRPRLRLEASLLRLYSRRKKHACKKTENSV